MKTLLCALSLILLLGRSSYSAEEQPVRVSYEGKIEVKELEPNLPYLSNRKYVLESVPKDLRSLQITVLAGNAKKPITASIPADTPVYVCVDSGRNAAREPALEEFLEKLRKDEWTYVGKIPVSDHRMEYLRVYRK
jgi:hypothetical protein